MRTSGVLVAVFALLTITFLLLAIGYANLTGVPSTSSAIKLGGWFGLATAAGRLVRSARAGGELDVRPGRAAARSRWAQFPWTNVPS